MSMEIYKDRIEIMVPNSEAVIEAQHYGIKDRTVGQYYMSEKTNEILSFLNLLEGKFYLDLCVTKGNLTVLMNKIKDNAIESCFKTQLLSQESALDSLEWLLKSGHIHQINAPTINEHAKYLKFDTDDDYLRCFMRLCLGDLCKIIIKKLSNNCFIIYLEENGTFESKLKDDVFTKWECNNEDCNGF